MEDNTITFHASSAGLDDIGKLGVKGISETDMADNAPLEEGEGADTLGAVDDLVRKNKVHGLDFLLERANSREGNNASDTNASQSGNVGTVRNLMRGKLMVNTMSRQEGDVGAVVRKNVNWGCSLSPRSSRVQESNRFVTFKLTQTSTTNNGDSDGLYK